MTQRLHNTFKAFRPSDSTRLGLAGYVISASCLKGNEWYEVSGKEEEDMKEIDF